MLSRRGFFGVTLGGAVAATVAEDVQPEPTPLGTSARVWLGLNLATVTVMTRDEAQAHIQGLMDETCFRPS